ncbi:MAG TPA: ATP-binding cassette domain-containing protein [Longimicrobium sp.]|jgi:ABC-type polysaccharide/polyol phosphate transport system ATPase subunit
MTGREIVRAEALGKRLGTFMPLRRGAPSFELSDVSFAVSPGDSIALLGHNGAGKTTLLRLLAGIYRPDHGRVEIRGVCSPIIGFTSPFSAALTPREHLRGASVLAGYDLDVEEAIRIAGLTERADLPARRLSTGQRTRLGLVAGLLTPADLYLVDEGLAVCDAPFRAWAAGQLRTRCAAGSAVIIAGQDLLSARALCERGLVMRGGKLVVDADIDSAIQAAGEGTSAVTGDAGVEVAETTVMTGAEPVVRVRCRVRGAPASYQLTLAVRDPSRQVVYASRTRISAPLPEGEDPVLVIPTAYLPAGTYSLLITLADAAGVPLATRTSAALIDLD